MSDLYKHQMIFVVVNNFEWDRRKKSC